MEYFCTVEVLESDDDVVDDGLNMEELQMDGWFKQFFQIGLVIMVRKSVTYAYSMTT